MHVVKQFDLPSELCPEMLKEFSDSLKINVFIEGWPAISTADATSCPCRLKSSASITTHLSTNMPVTFLHILPNIILHFLGIAAIGMRVTRNGVADFASQQFIQWHACPFPFDVPKCHIQPAQHIVDQNTVAPIGMDIRVLP